MKKICGIYKIENLKTGKIYIGQSINIHKRFKEHLRNGLYANSLLIDGAIQDEGYQNFSFEIIKECLIKELDNEERYFIQYYDCIYPNGYNKTSGGNSNHEMFIYSTPEIINNIINDLKNSSNLSIKDIAKKYDFDLSMIYYINRGTWHHKETEIYPLRKVKNISKQHNYCIDCGKEIYLYSTRCIKCNAIAARTVKRPDKETLYQLLLNNNGNFVKTGKQFNISDNTIREWCKSYNLPYHSSNYKVNIIQTRPSIDRRKTVAQINKDTGEIIQIFESARAAARFLNKKNCSHIVEVCNGIHLTAYGYKQNYI